MQEHHSESPMDLASLSPEQLIVLVKEGVAGAENELVIQALAWIKPHMHYPAGHPAGWRDHDDLESALLEALLEALRKFNLERGSPGSLRTFVVCHVLSRRSDFFRNQWRRERRYDHSKDVNEVLNSQAFKSDRIDKHELVPRVAGDPAQIAEGKDIWRRAVDAVHQRTTMMYAAWESLQEDRSVRSFARQLGISYWTAMQLRETLVACLRGVLIVAEPAEHPGCVSFTYDRSCAVTFTYDPTK